MYLYYICIIYGYKWRIKENNGDICRKNESRKAQKQKEEKQRSRQERSERRRQQTRSTKSREARGARNLEKQEMQRSKKSIKQNSRGAEKQRSLQFLSLSASLCLSSFLPSCLACLLSRQYIYIYIWLYLKKWLRKKEQNTPPLGWV